MSSPMIIPGPWGFLGGAGDALRNWGEVRGNQRRARLEDEDRIRQRNAMAISLWDSMNNAGQIQPGDPVPESIMAAYAAMGVPAPKGPSTQGLIQNFKGTNLKDLWAQYTAAKTPEERQALESRMSMAVGLPTPGAVAKDTADATTAVPQAKATLEGTVIGNRAGAAQARTAEATATMAERLGEKFATLNPEQQAVYFKMPSAMDMATLNDEDRVRILVPLIDEAKGDLKAATTLMQAKVGPEILAGMKDRHLSEALYAWNEARFKRSLELRKVASMEQARFIDVLTPSVNQIRQQLAAKIKERDGILGVQEFGKPLDTPEAQAKYQNVQIEIQGLTEDLNALNKLMEDRLGMTGGSGMMFGGGRAGASATSRSLPGVTITGRRDERTVVPPKQEDKDAQAVQMLMDGTVTEADLQRDVAAGALDAATAQRIIAAYRKKRGGLIQGIDTLIRKR